MNCTHDNLIKLFWNGGNENGERLELNEKGVKYALLLALKDFTPRTEKRIGKDPFGAEEMLEELEKTKSYSQKFLKFFDDDKKMKKNLIIGMERDVRSFLMYFHLNMKILIKKINMEKRKKLLI